MKLTRVWFVRRAVAWAAAFALLGALFLFPGTARADATPGLRGSGQPAPARASPEPHSRRIGLIVGGLVTFMVPYTLGVLAGVRKPGTTNQMCPCVETDTWRGDLLIPVAGPWMAIGSSPKDAALFSFLGIAQAAGVALTIGGVVRYATDGAPTGESGNAPGEGRRASRSGNFLGLGVLPTRDGAFGFVSARM